MRKNMLHRAVALVLTLTMLFLFPSAAFAAEGGENPGSSESEGETPGGEGGGTGNEGGGDSEGGEGNDPVDPPPAVKPSIVFKVQSISIPLGASKVLNGDIVAFAGFDGIPEEDITYAWSIDGGGQVQIANDKDQYATLVPQRVTETDVKLNLTVRARYTKDGETVTVDSNTCHVEVVYAKPTSITLGRGIIELDVGNDPIQTPLTATQWVETAGGNQPGLCDDSKIIWSVADKTIVGVTEIGGATTRLKAEKPGETEVTATVTWKEDNKDKSVSAVCSVTVTGLLVRRDGEDVTDQTITVPLGSEVQLECRTVGSKFGGTSPVWESTSQGVAYISSNGKVTTQAEGSTQIKVTQAGYVAYCTIHVVPNTVGSISTSISGDNNLELYSLLSGLNGAYREAMNNAGITGSNAPGLSYLTNLSVSTGQGVLYYNYVSPSNHGYGVGGGENYYVTPGVGSRGLTGVTFVPNPGFAGEAVINYNGYDANRNSFAGTIRVSVTASKDVAYMTAQNTPITFVMEDFNAVHRDATGRDIRYVTFDLPAANQGTLYYDYIGTGEYATLVTASEHYNRTASPYLDRVSFVPAKDYAGAVRITYHVTDTANAVSTGSVTIQVSSQSGGRTTEINYVAQRGEDTVFKAADFNSVCREVLDGESLDYLRFDPLPDSSLGTLWYRYSSSSSRSRVSSANRYYLNNSTARPGVGGVYFVPEADTVGTVTIPFTAYSTGGNRFSGTVTIQYNDVGEGELTFHIKASERALFNAADFNEACLTATGSSFDYVCFDVLPNATTQGSLYSNYYSASSIGSRITGITGRYYRTGSLSRVAFIPVTSFSGTVTIPFTAYKSDGSRVFTGNVVIQVEGIGDFTVRYNAYSGRAVQFNAESFAAACQTVTGNTLNYVQFQLPNSSQGTLYYNYDAKKTSNTKVTAGTSYYRASTYSRKVSDVYFLPASNFTGTVSLTYTGVASNNVRYTGTVQIQVSASVAQVVSFTGTSLPLAMNAASFYQACSQVLPSGLSYIEFTTLPTAAQGVMYWGYDPPNPGTKAATGTRYYYNGTPGINWLTFVPKTDYTGQVSLSYRGYDSSGIYATGTLNLVVNSAATACHFNDMAVHTWAAPSVEFLYHTGIVQGTNEAQSQYSPANYITRSEFTVMLCRAFGLETASTTSFQDVPANSFYAKATATAKDLGIVTGSADGLFHPTEELTRQEAMLMLYRAMSVAGRTLPGSGANLSGYPDNGQISAETRTAVAVMVQLGVLRGTDAGLLAPTKTLTRAEMAVVMHRAMTL